MLPATILRYFVPVHFMSILCSYCLFPVAVMFHNCTSLYSFTLFYVMKLAQWLQDINKMYLFTYLLLE